MDQYTQKPHFSKDAIQAYVLLHAKFLLSFDGLLLMKYKFRQKVFGLCTQPQCQNQALIPVGVSGNFGVKGVHVYCPRCNAVTKPTNKHDRKVDGSAFGPSFPIDLEDQHRLK
ncbi:MAG: hypothetical protein EZS28_038276 [Streblomastix strix]|uniref:Casein kinase II subunit beta n=1 Tax=Streblomastix strix TaxID=222440 RepID=A0A5J4U6H1_9EUKA|nr:MAG: hypothetical protein EZS28_038276 [Streblomastix strix]